MEIITLHSESDWAAFVADNHEAIESEYGAVQEAYTRACQGGLTFGGGAAAGFFVIFVDN